MILDPDILTAALEALEAQRSRVAGQIALVRQLLGNSPERFSSTEVVGKQRKKREPLSEEVKKRMAASQRKRWAAAKKKPKPEI
jgi:hypothetical protein